MYMTYEIAEEFNSARDGYEEAIKALGLGVGEGWALWQDGPLTKQHKFFKHLMDDDPHVQVFLRDHYRRNLQEMSGGSYNRTRNTDTVRRATMWDWGKSKRGDAIGDILAFRLAIPDAAVPVNAPMPTRGYQEIIERVSDHDEPAVVARPGFDTTDTSAMTPDQKHNQLLADVRGILSRQIKARPVPEKELLLELDAFVLNLTRTAGSVETQAACQLVLKKITELRDGQPSGVHGW